jgi:carbon monoxide dehydrogenase subunit G
MKLRNEFVVAAPLERTWETLLDVPRVASALPGAAIEPGPNGNSTAGDHRGRMKVKIGPVTAEYAGTARLEEVDEDGHAATFYVQGSGGQGTAAATIVNRLEPADGGTRVVVETDLRVTGRAAQFGRGLMEDVAAAMLGEFAKRLEREILDEKSTKSSQTGSDPGQTRVRPGSEGGQTPDMAVSDGGNEVLDLGAAAWEPLLRRYGLPVAAGVLLLLLLLRLTRKPTVVVVRFE